MMPDDLMYPGDAVALKSTELTLLHENTDMTYSTGTRWMHPNSAMTVIATLDQPRSIRKALLVLTPMGYVGWTNSYYLRRL